MWVTAVPCCVWNLLTMLFLCSPVSEWLLCLAVFHGYWCLSFALQEVSSCCVLLCFKPADDACPLPPGSEWLLLLAVLWVCWWCVLCSPVGKWCSVLLCFEPADNAWPLLSSWWAAVPCCVSSLLMIPVLYSLGSGWLLCTSVCQACWWCLSSAFQRVSSCYSFLCFNPVDDACSLLPSL